MPNRLLLPWTESRFYYRLITPTIKTLVRKTINPYECEITDRSARETDLYFPLSGVVATLRAVPKKEGYLGLYKGNGAMMVRIFPYGAIQFMAFDNYKKVNLQFSNSIDLLVKWHLTMTWLF